MDIRDLIPWARSNVPTRRAGEDDPFRSLQTEINRVFENFWRGLPAPTGGFGAGWPFEAATPRVDVSETDKEIEITAELPGLSENDVEISLTEDVLTLKGEKKSEREEKDKNYYVSERSFGSFRRSIPLPSGVDQDKVKATFKNGVLRITVPKTEEAKKEVKKIAVSKG